VPKLLALVLCTAAAVVVATGAGGGDPGRGAVVWTSNGCGACHAFAAAGSSGTAGPSIDRWLVPDARRLKLSTGALAFRRIYWGGRGMPPYGSALTAQELDDLVSFVTRGPFTAPPEKPVPLAPQPAPPPVATASAATVAHWVRQQRLRGRAALGAGVFASGAASCLSCHTYLGKGMRRRGAPDLSEAGRGRRTAAGLAAYVARPYLRGNTLMPAYADLGAETLARLGAFLKASTRRP
jgi:mono/diheme cytochrome c family protein